MVKRQNNAEVKKVIPYQGRVSAPVSKKEMLMYEEGKTLQNSVLLTAGNSYGDKRQISPTSNSC